MNRPPAWCDKPECDLRDLGLEHGHGMPTSSPFLRPRKPSLERRLSGFRPPWQAR